VAEEKQRNWPIQVYVKNIPEVYIGSTNLWTHHLSALLDRVGGWSKEGTV